MLQINMYAKNKNLTFNYTYQSSKKREVTFKDIGPICDLLGYTLK